MEVLVNGKKKYNAIITLGCIIKGQTAHFEYISGSVINSLANLTSLRSTSLIFVKSLSTIFTFKFLMFLSLLIKFLVPPYFL